MRNTLMSVLLLALTCITVPASAQEEEQLTQPMFIIADCYPENELKDWLEEEYGEIGFVQSQSVFRRFDGAFSAGEVIIYANPDYLSFTVTVNFPDGVGCVVFMGEKLEPVILDDGI